MSLQVLLEKLAGVCLVEKLRYIQLYEADNQLLPTVHFWTRRHAVTYSQGLLPEEHFSKNGSTADDVEFDKTLMEDLSRQSRIPMSIVSVDRYACPKLAKKIAEIFFKNRKSIV